MGFVFPMVFLWFSYGFPNGFPMVFRWFSYGFSMVFLWFSFGFPMVLLALDPSGASGRAGPPGAGGRRRSFFLGFSYGFPLVFLWFSFGAVVAGGAGDAIP